jgi:hypothetical protein
MALTAADVDRFEASRHRLEAIAYRLLGSAGEAEDAVRRRSCAGSPPTWTASRSPRPG